MRFYYTVISKAGDAQRNPALSLGGFVSSSPVPNAIMGSLFSDISSYTIQRDTTEYVALVLKNIFDYSVKDIKLYIPKDDSFQCKYRLAVVELSSTGEMESVVSIDSKPLFAEFYETSSTDKIELSGEMQPGDSLGLWIERKLDLTSEEIVGSTNCAYLYENRDKVKQTIETVSLKIDFDYA